MSWRRWKVGALVAVVLSLFVAGTGVAAGMTWQAFVVVLSSALVTHFGAFLKDHPPETITFDSTPPIKLDGPGAAGKAAGQGDVTNK